MKASVVWRAGEVWETLAFTNSCVCAGRVRVSRKGTPSHTLTMALSVCLSCFAFLIRGLIGITWTYDLVDMRYKVDIWYIRFYRYLFVEADKHVCLHFFLNQDGKGEDTRSNDQL